MQFPNPGRRELVIGLDNDTHHVQVGVKGLANAKQVLKSFSMFTQARVLSAVFMDGNGVTHKLT